MEKEKKKKIIFVLACFLFAIVFSVLSFVSYKFGDDDSDQEKTETQNTQSEVNNSSYENTSGDETPSTEEVEELKDNADSDPLDQNEQQDSTYTENFQINELPDELLTFINNDTENLKKSIQELLYSNGYYGYSSAEFEDYAEIDYRYETITLKFSVRANEDTVVGATYYRSTGEWNIQIW